MRTSILVLAMCAAPGAAQVSASPFFELEALELAALGGGAASSGHAAFAALSDLASGEIASPLFRATAGFLGACDPMPTNAPVVFGAVPGLGPKAGGTAITITGLNFDLFGSGAVVEVGGALASGVAIASSTELTATTPPGEPGPADVAVLSAFGTGALPQGFLYTPAVLASASAPVGGTIELAHHGEPGALIATSASLSATSIPLGEWGTLLIGPAGIVEVVPLTALPPPGGVLTVSLPVPQNPGLSGKTVYFQAVQIVAAPQVEIALSNRAQTLVF